MIFVDTFMHLQVYIISVSILLVILIKIITEKDNHGFQDKIFTTILCFTLCVLIFEAVGWVFDGKPGMYARIIVTISDMLEMVVGLIPGTLWMIYVDYFIYNSINRIKKLSILSGVSLIYFIILSITAPFNKLFYYIDSSNTYHRGVWYWQSQCLYYMFFIYVIIILIWNRNKIPRKTFMPLLLFPIPPFIGLWLQMAFYGLSLIWSGVSISILIVYVYIQSKKSSVDYLTGLYNRRNLDLYLESVLKKNTFNKIIAVLMIDVNKFKEINDTWGHEMGDRALKHFATILRKCFHHEDFIARYAGDEFVVVLELEDNKDVDKVIERLKDIVEVMKGTEEVPYELSFSVGYSLFPEDGQDISEILRVADERMYVEKNKMRRRMVNHRI